MPLTQRLTPSLVRARPTGTRPTIWRRLAAGVVAGCLSILWLDVADAQTPTPTVVESPNVKVLTGPTAPVFQDEMNHNRRRPRRDLRHLPRQRQFRERGQPPGADKGWTRTDLVKDALGDPVLPQGQRPDTSQPRVNNGITGDARRSTSELGQKLFDMKVDYAVRQIRQLIG